MTRRSLHRLLASVVVGVALACSLAVDTSEIDSGCPPEMKLCAGSCVRIDDPEYGCTQEGCGPCQEELGGTFGDRLIPKCEEGQCVPDRCLYGWGCDDCSKRLLTDPNNCGSCFHGCDGGRCSRGRCAGEGAAGAAGDTSN